MFPWDPHIWFLYWVIHRVTLSTHCPPLILLTISCHSCPWCQSSLRCFVSASVLLTPPGRHFYLLLRIESFCLVLLFLRFSLPPLHSMHLGSLFDVSLSPPRFCFLAIFWKPFSLFLLIRPSVMCCCVKRRGRFFSLYCSH